MIKKLLLYLPIILVLISSAYAIPASWYGYVTLDSSTADDGVIVDAYIDGSIAGTTTVGAVQSNGYYLVHVEGNVGDEVSFKIYGNNAAEMSQAWIAGFNHPSFNVTATSTTNGGACPTYTGYTSGTSVANLGCAGGYCVHDLCRAATTYCGDGYCDTGESCSTDNTACSSGYACTNGCQSTGGGGSGSGSSSGSTTTANETEEECVESWSCTAWTGCVAPGTQVRTCTDANSCGTVVNKPSEQQACVYVAPQVTVEAPAEEIEVVTANPPAERGTEIGEVRTIDSISWKWSGTTWVQEGTQAYEQIRAPATQAAELTAAEEEPVVPLELGILVISVAAALLAVFIYHMHQKRKLR